MGQATGWRRVRHERPGCSCVPIMASRVLISHTPLCALRKGRPHAVATAGNNPPAHLGLAHGDEEEHTMLRDLTLLSDAALMTKRAVDRSLKAGRGVVVCVRHLRTSPRALRPLLLGLTWCGLWA